MRTFLRASSLAGVAAFVAVLCSPLQMRGADFSSDNTFQPPPAYPLKKSTNGRYLVDSKDAPFLLALIRLAAAKGNPCAVGFMQNNPDENAYQNEPPHRWEVGRLLEIPDRPLRPKRSVGDGC